MKWSTQSSISLWQREFLWLRQVLKLVSRWRTFVYRSALFKMKPKRFSERLENLEKKRHVCLVLKIHKKGRSIRPWVLQLYGLQCVSRTRIAEGVGCTNEERFPSEIKNLQLRSKQDPKREISIVDWLMKRTWAVLRKGTSCWLSKSLRRISPLFLLI